MAAGLLGLVMGASGLAGTCLLGASLTFFYFQHAWERGEMRRWAQAAKQDEKNGSQRSYSTLGNTEGEDEAERGEKTAEAERRRDSMK